jgi:hypothetical protein
VTATEVTSEPVSWTVGKMLMSHDSLQQPDRRQRRHSHSVDGS